MDGDSILDEPRLFELWFISVTVVDEDGGVRAESAGVSVGREERTVTSKFPRPLYGVNTSEYEPSLKSLLLQALWWMLQWPYLRCLVHDQ